MSDRSQCVLLWSKRQNAFHIQPASDLFEKNADAMKSDKTLNDYHPIYMGPKSLCEQAAEHSRAVLVEREKSRGA